MNEQQASKLCELVTDTYGAGAARLIPIEDGSRYAVMVKWCWVCWSFTCWERYRKQQKRKKQEQRERELLRAIDFAETYSLAE